MRNIDVHVLSCEGKKGRSYYIQFQGTGVFQFWVNGDTKKATTESGGTDSYRSPQGGSRSLCPSLYKLNTPVQQLHQKPIARCRHSKVLCLRKKGRTRGNMATALKLLTLALFFSVPLQGKEVKFTSSRKFLSGT
jgi:hypothetical protein